MCGVCLCAWGVCLCGVCACGMCACVGYIPEETDIGEKKWHHNHFVTHFQQPYP